MYEALYTQCFAEKKPVQATRAGFEVNQLFITRRKTSSIYTCTGCSKNVPILKFQKHGDNSEH